MIFEFLKSLILVNCNPVDFLHFGHLTTDFVADIVVHVLRMQQREIKLRKHCMKMGDIYYRLVEAT